MQLKKLSLIYFIIYIDNSIIMNGSGNIIGIYSIFIGKYNMYYESFLSEVHANFLPTYKKKYFIITDIDHAAHETIPSSDIITLKIQWT